MALEGFAAIDFHVNEDCGMTRAKLLPVLKRFSLRMENVTGPWVHLDNAPVKTSRFFKP